MGMKYTCYSLWCKKTHNKRFNTWYKANCGKVTIKRVDKEILTKLLNNDTITDNNKGKSKTNPLKNRV